MIGVGVQYNLKIRSLPFLRATAITDRYHRRIELIRIVAVGGGWALPPLHHGEEVVIVGEANMGNIVSKVRSLGS